ncbi:hypothetical protein JTE90_029582 [Oedothorax gibbosus]|uniref:Uncharacterized protein n=1 Tax=Oedothorax gibbosus TaxID=931172 RepID=A0AAV6VD88_9ARAC|nr:hypothetical protein JTE90_029582 [Oedothorax gibbosus]
MQSHPYFSWTRWSTETVHPIVTKPSNVSSPNHITTKPLSPKPYLHLPNPLGGPFGAIPSPPNREDQADPSSPASVLSPASAEAPQKQSPTKGGMLRRSGIPRKRPRLRPGLS